MVWATISPKHKIPVSPTNGPESQVFQNVESKIFCTRPPTFRICSEDHSTTVACLARKDEFVWCNLLGSLQILSVQSSVPVHANSINVLLGSLVTVNSFSPLHHMIFIMIITNDLHTWLLFVQHRTKVVTNEGS